MLFLPGIIRTFSLDYNMYWTNDFYLRSVFLERALLIFFSQTYLLRTLAVFGGVDSQQKSNSFSTRGDDLAICVTETSNRLLRHSGWTYLLGVQQNSLALNQATDTNPLSIPQ